jgi:hypothetical protein
MVSQIELIEQLKSDVPARNSIPGDEQYRKCIEDAVADYSRRKPRRKVTTLTIVSGTASYDLPKDFVHLIRITQPAEYADSGVIISSEGLVPVGSKDWEEHHTIAAGADGIMELTIYPTPTYSTTRDVWYGAGHVLDASNEYAEMTWRDSDIITYKARAIALELQANKAAQEAWQYSIGDERVSKEKLAAELRAQADAQLSRYNSALEAMPAGVRSRYDSLGR